MKRAYDGGGLIISDVVYAELVPQFQDRRALDRTLGSLEILVVPGTRETAFVAGDRFARYRRSGGPRTRILTDFLIGSHALQSAERFVTRDRGFYRSYFGDLRFLA